MVYDFTSTTETPRGTYHSAGTIWFDGDSYRAELSADPSRETDVVISRDRDATAMQLNAEEKSWTWRHRMNDVRSSKLFLWPMTPSFVAGPVRIEQRLEGKTQLEGFKVVKHRITVTFRVDTPGTKGNAVPGTLKTTTRIWTVESLPRLPVPLRLRTGYPAVDNKLTAHFEKIEGMVVWHEMEVTRIIDGGPPMSEKTTTAVRNIRQLDIDPTRFEVPAEFAFRGAQEMK